MNNPNTLAAIAHLTDRIKQLRPMATITITQEETPPPTPLPTVEAQSFPNRQKAQQEANRQKAKGWINAQQSTLQTPAGLAWIVVLDPSKGTLLK